MHPRLLRAWPNLHGPPMSNPSVLLENKSQSGRESGKTKKQMTTVYENALRIVTLPALQKNFVHIFYVFAWEFCIEKWRGFLVNFFWSPSPTKWSTKSPRKIRGKFGAKFGAKFGTKIRIIREIFVLPLFWPKESCQTSEDFRYLWRF